jgi:hypothetical protein
MLRERKTISSFFNYNQVKARGSTPGNGVVKSRICSHSLLAALPDAIR